MNIIENEAKEFYDVFFDYMKPQNLDSLNSTLSSKLYNFKKDRDKLDFLKSLRTKINERIEDHLTGCQKQDCNFMKKHKTGLFVIDQEVDEINSYFSYNPPKENSFSSSEESLLQTKLNDALDKLNKLGYGQEVIYNEIEELKNHFGLGNKNWFQLMKGKFIDLAFEKVIDKTILNDLFNEITDGFNNIPKSIQ